MDTIFPYSTTNNRKQPNEKTDPIIRHADARRQCVRAQFLRNTGAPGLWSKLHQGVLREKEMRPRLQESLLREKEVRPRLQEGVLRQAVTRQWPALTPALPGGRRVFFARGAAGYDFSFHRRTAK